MVQQYNQNSNTAPTSKTHTSTNKPYPATTTVSKDKKGDKGGKGGGCGGKC